MKKLTRNIEIRDQLIANLLWYGTWFATVLIAIGVIINALAAYFPLSFGGYPIIKIGIILFIFLPVARVILMLVLFLREHNYLYATIACFVLCTIAAGVFIEIDLP
ncbi:TPA: DUF1634 domain-containing protein [Providencia stuartii]|uniref:DUF1634 domain-containing protein n=1 Tax=Providencia stuartii TaxID=588 RepID=UPI00113FF4C4|nr:MULTISPECIES: DUF1634 domain-containing protein [Providencia]MBN5560876.1 DUF1634 domain-containing protein [Providencia stuartii]MBN5599309.1 DUF1634 domain-containing protein [Providencia stuartii]MBN5603635.1 DUF1634 domain-containing protein [Providencia stuartii]MCL8323842.1 DUF1634 domain-containing protein [Providencia thailandensis]MDF4175085.1 DUF1634 domain-containing protein [Providencia thailandensis]